jgi:hypothetical protein
MNRSLDLVYDYLRAFAEYALQSVHDGKIIVGGLRNEIRK